MDINSGMGFVIYCYIFVRIRPWLVLFSLVLLIQIKKVQYFNKGWDESTPVKQLLLGDIFDYEFVIFKGPSLLCFHLFCHS